MKKGKDIRKVPNLRFPGFEGEWLTSSLNQICERIGDGLHGTPNYTEGTGYYFINGNNLANGEISISASTKEVSYDEWFRNKKKLTDNTLFLSINGTIGNIARYKGESVMLGKSVAYLDFKESHDFYFQLLQSGKIQNHFNSELTGTTIKNLSLKTIRETEIVSPSSSERAQIGRFLNFIDERIQTQSKIIEKLKSLIKATIQELGNSGKRKGWKKQYLREILTERKEVNEDNYSVHSVSVSRGVINQIEYLGRSFAAKNTAHYNVVCFGDIVYTKSPTGDFPYGIIKQSYIPQKVAVSPLYGVFTPENIYIGNILHYYFDNPINTNNYLHSLIQKGAKNTINITNQGFLNKAIYLPTNEKQIQTIAELLNKLKAKINLEERFLEELNNQKQYFLQSLFI